MNLSMPCNKNFQYHDLKFKSIKIVAQLLLLHQITEPQIIPFKVYLSLRKQKKC